MPENAYKDENGVSTLIASSTTDGKTPVRLYADPVTHRLLVSDAFGGTVTSFAFTDANGFDGTVTNATTTPTLSLTTTVADTQVMFSNATAIAGDSNLTFNSSTDILSVAGTTIGAATILGSANDATALGSGANSFSDLFLASGGVINWNNGNVVATQTAATITFTGSAGAQMVVTSGTGGTVYVASGVTTGAAFSATSLTSGAALVATSTTTATNGVIQVGGTGTTTGVGYLFNTTAAGATTQRAISITGSATMTADYTGSLVSISPSKTMSAAATRTTSGMMFDVNPTYTTAGTLASIHNVTGNTAHIRRTLSSTSNGASATLNMSSALLALTNTKGTETTPVVDTGILFQLQQQNATSSGAMISGVNSGTGYLMTLTGTGNTGIGTATPTAKLEVAGAVGLGNFTVATLPNGQPVGAIAVVTDQLTTPAAKGVAPTGGGAVVCAVIHIGGNAWVGI